MRTCADCGCRLSQYNPDPRCAACDHARDTTYEDYFASSSIAKSREGQLRGADTCKRGHDLLIHGQTVDAGGGRLTRRCMLCRREREAAYQRERRAKAAAAKRAAA